MLRSTPAIVIILTLHGLASFFPSEHLPHPGTISNVHLLKGRSLGMVFASFFSVPTSPLSLLLTTYNTFVLFAIINPPTLSLSKMKTQIRTVGIWCVIALAILCGRVALGFAFSRGTGWAYPLFFFNDSIHEVSRGLSPIILYAISYIAYFSEEDTRSPWTNFLFLLTALLLWLPNAFQGPIFFWSFSALSVSGVQFLISLIKSDNVSPSWNIHPIPSIEKARSHSERRRTRLGRLGRSLKIYITLVLLVTTTSYLHSIRSAAGRRAHARSVFTLPRPVLVDFLILSAPRQTGNQILRNTLSSYLTLPDRFSITAYTTIPLRAHRSFAFESVDAKYDPTSREGLAPVKFVVDDIHPSRSPYISFRRPQASDLFSALSWMINSTSPRVTGWIGIMEDDFEWCEDGHQALQALIWEVAVAESQLSSSPGSGSENEDDNEDKFCGIFIATGGSGLIVRPFVVPAILEALSSAAAVFEPTDRVLQRCLLGHPLYPSCARCASASSSRGIPSASPSKKRFPEAKLAASRRLLLRHTGAMASTYAGRMYPEERWQCGWRHPFNGEPGVWVP